MLAESLRRAKPDVLIAEAGGLQISEVIKSCPSLAQVIWVARGGGRLMEWNEVPEGIGGRAGVSVWHELVDENKEDVRTELPANVAGETVPGITTFWPSEEDPVGDMTDFSQKVIHIEVDHLDRRLTISPLEYRCCHSGTDLRFTSQ